MISKAAWFAAGLLVAACGDNVKVTTDVDGPMNDDAYATVFELR